LYIRTAPPSTLSSTWAGHDSGWVADARGVVVAIARRLFHSSRALRLLLCLVVHKPTAVPTCKLPCTSVDECNCQERTVTVAVQFNPFNATYCHCASHFANTGEQYIQLPTVAVIHPPAVSSHHHLHHQSTQNANMRPHLQQLRRQGFAGSATRFNTWAYNLHPPPTPWQLAPRQTPCRTDHCHHSASR
jgi:hypothetical protein